MKNILFLAAAATALFFTASCDKTSSSSSGVVLPAPQHAAQAKKLLLDSSSSNPGIDFVEFTESGRYIVRNRIIKADESVEFIRGLYTVAGNVYTLNGFGTVTINGNLVTIKRTGGEDIVVSFTEAPTFPANDFYTTLTRAWRIDKTDVSVSFDGKTSVGVVKDGCDIPAILKELEQKGNVDLKDEAVAGYVVKEINFTMAKTIEIAFTSKPSLVGTMSLSENGKINYELSGAIGIELFSGKASGTINTNPGLGKNQIEFSLDAEVSSNSRTYKGKVRFILSPAQ